MARRIRGRTQGELGEEVALSRAHVSRLERHGGRVDDELLEAFTNVLRFPAEFFNQAVHGEPDLARLHFRKNARVTQKDQLRLTAYGAVLAKNTEELGRRCNFTPVNLPQLTFTTPAAIEKIAEDVRRQWDLRLDNPIASVAKVAERAGIFVGTFDLDVGVEGFCWRTERPLIMVRRSAPPSRFRWSLAHEMAHLILHHGNATPSQEIEDEANLFAGAFLIPRAAMWREFPKDRRNVDWNKLLEMKMRWGVSVQAILMRAYALGLIDAAAKRRAFIRLTQKGWKKSEPLEPEPERPSVLARAIRVAFPNVAQARRGEPIVAGLPADVLEELTGETLAGVEQGEVASSHLANLLKLAIPDR